MSREEQKAYIYQLIRANLYRLAHKEGQADDFSYDFIDLEIDDEDFYEVEQEKEEDEGAYFEEDPYDEAIDYYEFERAKVVSIDDEKRSIDIGDFESWEDKLLEKQVVREIKTFLSDDLWQVVEAKYWYGYNVTEIAALKNSSPVVIQRKLQKARDLLKSYFTK